MYRELSFIVSITLSESSEIIESYRCSRYPWYLGDRIETIETIENYSWRYHDNILKGFREYLEL